MWEEEPPSPLKGRACDPRAELEEMERQIDADIARQGSKVDLPRFRAYRSAVGLQVCARDDEGGGGGGWWEPASPRGPEEPSPAEVDLAFARELEDHHPVRPRTPELFR